MNLRDLRYVVAVADHRHFGKAAEACFVSQPTLSTQIKKLEKELGVELIERNPRQIMLTETGDRVVERARIILGEAEVEIAKMFQHAAEAYQNNPVALQLRAMNILYEGLKQKGGMMVVPSSIVDSVGPHGVMSLAALGRSQEQQSPDSTPERPRDAQGRKGGGDEPEDIVPLPPVFHSG